MAESKELTALDDNMTFIKATVKNDLVWFSDQLVKKGFVPRRIATSVLGMFGVTPVKQATELMDEVYNRVENADADKRGALFDDFVDIFSHNRAYSDLVKKLKPNIVSDLPVMLAQSVIKDNIRKLKQRFLLLKNRARDILEMKKVAVKLVADILTSLSPDEDEHHRMFLKDNVEAFVTAKQHADIFVTMNFHWNYLDPGLLDHLVDSSSELEEIKEDMKEIKEDMKTYKIELKNFRETTSLKLFYKTQKKKKSRLSPDFQEVVVEFNWNENVMLQYVEEFRQEYASHYSVHDFAMMIAQMHLGCFIITWFIPACIVKKLLAKENLPGHILKKYSVSKLHIAGVLVYHKVTAIAASTDEAKMPKEKFKFVNIPSDFLCPVMGTPLVEPHLTSCCGNHLLPEVVARLQDANRVCPLCNEDFWVTMLDRNFLRQVNSLEVQCLNDESKCQWKGELSSFIHHVENSHAIMDDTQYAKNTPEASEQLTQNKPQDPQPIQCIEEEMTDVGASSERSPASAKAVVESTNQEPQQLSFQSPPSVPWLPPDIPPTCDRQPSYAEAVIRSIKKKDRSVPRSPGAAATSLLQQTPPIVPPASQPSPLQNLPLIPRKVLPTASLQVMDGSSSLRQHQPDSVKFKAVPLLKQPLVVSNYHIKFCKLLVSEEVAHSKLLRDKCDGHYSVFLYPAGKEPPEIEDRRETHARYGYINGMDSDLISYATQSAGGATINGNIRCDILHYNMHHVKNRLYIGLTSQGVRLLLPLLRLVGGQGLESKLLPIQFQLKDRYFKSLKQSIRNLEKSVILRILPTRESFMPPNPVDSDVLDSYNVRCSTDQYKALKVISTAYPSGPPVLIAGPFGTGKTHVLAIAAHYFLQDRISRHTAVLVCTQQHNSADAYLKMYDDLKLADERTKIIRLILYQKPYLKHYEMLIDKFKKEHHHYKHCLVVATCQTAKRMSEFIRPGFFTHIFLDEGAQMREPEAVAPLCMAGPNTKIVIAGDKYQVGPQMLVLGEEPQEYGLAVSLLERLYTLYQKLGKVAQSYCAHLSTNFRCHQGILDLARQVAYTDLKLTRAKGEQDEPFPLRFVCTSLDRNVKETRESICQTEGDAALKQASEYLLKWRFSSSGIKSPKSVCFLSPCRGQVTVATNTMDEKFNYQVRFIKKLVTYQIQGNEFRALFISTSEPTDSNSKTKDPTKSISDPSVFITAITRAASLVVAVGNPFMLLRREDHMVHKFKNRGHCWSLFLKACFDNNTVSVYPGIATGTDEILKQLRSVLDESLEDIYKTSVPPLKTFSDQHSKEELSVAEPTSPSVIESKKHVYGDVIGKGHFGVVCHLQHQVDKREYAVKIILNDNPKKKSKVESEVDALSKLAHDNIVRYYDSWIDRAPPNWKNISPWKFLSPQNRMGTQEKYGNQFRVQNSSASYNSPYSKDSGVDAGTYSKYGRQPNQTFGLNSIQPECLCIRMELCDTTLKRWLADNVENRQRKEVAGWFMEILEGVRFIHSKGLIHGDLKPANIFFKEKKIKIGDFGLVTTSKVGATQISDGKKYGENVDIKALAITYIEMNCPSADAKEIKKAIAKFKKNSLPRHFEHYLVCEARIIQWMLSENTPTAEDISKNEDFQKLKKSSGRSSATIHFML